MNTKPWYKSKLVIAGASVIAIAVLQAYIDGLTTDQIIKAAFGALIIVLRKFTNTAIG